MLRSTLVQLDLTDGCAAQFDGKDNYHQVAEWPQKTGGVRRNHSILVTMHGKNICDSLSNMILAAIRSAVANSEIVDAGTLALVLWLALNKQLPTIPKEKKEGWWAVDDIYYGFLDSSLFTIANVCEAKGFSGSAEKHRFISTCMDAERARVDGLLSTSTAFCGCANCTRFDFSHCLMHGLGGMDTKLQSVKAPRVHFSGAPSQTATLEAFAKTLAKGQLRAVRVDSAEKGIEGDFWLADVLGKAQQATARQASASELFEEGWWIVKIEWYKREPNSIYNYKLLPKSSRWLAVNAIIRVDGIAFEGGRASRSAVYVLSKRSREVIADCV